VQLAPWFPRGTVGLHQPQTAGNPWRDEIAQWDEEGRLIWRHQWKEVPWSSKEGKLTNKGTMMPQGEFLQVTPRCCMVGAKDRDKRSNARLSGFATWLDHLIPEMDQLWLFLFMVVLLQEKSCNTREWSVFIPPSGQ
jgi:hypothetical protein